MGTTTGALVCNPCSFRYYHGLKLAPATDISFPALQPLHLPVVPIGLHHRQEHRVGALVVLRPEFELYSVDVYGFVGVQSPDEAVPAQLAPSGLQSGNGQASRQVALQGNEPGFRSGIVIRQRGVIPDDHGIAAVVGMGHNLGDVHSLALGAQGVC